jgi:hypothetical protein
MIASKRRALIRSIDLQALYIVSGCKIRLEVFKPGQSQPSMSQPAATQNPDPQLFTSQLSANKPATSRDLCTFMGHYWDWLDECWTTLEAEESTHTEYDFDVVPVIFHSRKGLRGLYGEEYCQCQKALAERPARIPWASEFNENGQLPSFKHVP